MNRSTIFSIGMLIAFFLPWYDISIFTFSGYNIPTSLDKISQFYSILNKETGTALYKISYALYIIPICCLINIGEYFFHNKTSNYLAGRFQFPLGILVLFVMPVAFITPEDKQTILTPFLTPKVDIGYYLTVIFGFCGFFFSKDKSIETTNSSNKNDDKNNSSNLLNQLSQLQNLKEKNVVSDEIYEKQKIEILNKLENGIENSKIGNSDISLNKLQVSQPFETKENFSTAYTNIRSGKQISLTKQWTKRNKKSIFLSFTIILSFAFGAFMWYFNRKYIPIPYLKHDGRYIIVDSASMEPISDNEYDYISLFSNDFAVVRNNNKYGIIDKKSGIKVPIEYDYIENFNCGLAQVKINNKWGYLDLNGKVVIPIKYNYANKFNNNVAWVQSENGMWDLIEKSGKVLIENKNEPTTFDTNFTLVYDEDNKKWSLINNMNGQYIFEKKYDYAQYANEGLIRVYNVIDNDSNQRTKEGLINIKGEVVVPPKYNEIDNFYEGLSVITDNDKCGVIDTKGNIVIQQIYDEIVGFKNGVSFVRLNGKWGVIDNKGQIIIPLKFFGSRYGYKLTETTGYSYFNNENFAFFQENNKWGLINKSGFFKIKPKYDGYRYFGEGINGVMVGGKWGFINENGDEFIEPRYYINFLDNPAECKNGLILVSNSNDSQLMFFTDKTGREYRDK